MNINKALPENPITSVPVNSTNDDYQLYSNECNDKIFIIAAGIFFISGMTVMTCAISNYPEGMLLAIVIGAVAFAAMKSLPSNQAIQQA
jgi:hypothetical protein